MGTGARAAKRGERTKGQKNQRLKLTKFKRVGKPKEKKNGE